MDQFDKIFTVIVVTSDNFSDLKAFIVIFFSFMRAAILDVSIQSTSKYREGPVLCQNFVQEQSTPNYLYSLYTPIAFVYAKIKLLKKS